MSKVKRRQGLVRDGLYYLTEHADEEAAAEGFTGLRVLAVVVVFVGFAAAGLRAAVFLAVIDFSLAIPRRR